MNINFRRLFDIVVKDWAAKLTCVSIAVMLTLFYKISTVDERYLRIPFEIITNRSFITAEDVPKNVKVVIRGNSEDIFTVTNDDLSAYADFSDVKEEGTFERTVKVKIGGNALYIKPLEIAVDLKKINLFFEKKITRSVRVEPLFKGIPAEGFELAEVSLSSNCVVVEGPESVVSEIGSLKMKPVNISGKSDNFTVPVEIDNKNTHVSIVKNDIKFSAVLTKIRFVHNFNHVDIIFANVDSSLNVVSPVSEGSVKIEVEESGDAETLDASDLKLFADLGKISSPGSYQIPLEPAVPESVNIVSFNPGVIDITVAAKEEKDDQGNRN